MYGKEDRPKVSVKTQSSKMNVLLVENLGDEEEAESPAPPTDDAWCNNFNKYINENLETIPHGMTLVQWWHVCAEY